MAYSKKIPDTYDENGNGIFYTYDGTVKPMRLKHGWKCVKDAIDLKDVTDLKSPYLKDVTCSEIHTGCCGSGQLTLTLYENNCKRTIDIESSHVFTVAQPHVLENQSGRDATILLFTQVPHPAICDYISIYPKRS
jgi:hypothetical protein